MKTDLCWYIVCIEMTTFNDLCPELTKEIGYHVCDTAASYFSWITVCQSWSAMSSIFLKISNMTLYGPSTIDYPGINAIQAGSSLNVTYSCLQGTNWNGFCTQLIYGNEELIGIKHYLVIDNKKQRYDVYNIKVSKAKVRGASEVGFWDQVIITLPISKDS